MDKKGIATTTAAAAPKKKNKERKRITKKAQRNDYMFVQKTVSHLPISFVHQPLQLLSSSSLCFSMLVFPFYFGVFFPCVLFIFSKHSFGLCVVYAVLFFFLLFSCLRFERKRVVFMLATKQNALSFFSK